MIYVVISFSDMPLQKPGQSAEVPPNRVTIIAANDEEAKEKAKRLVDGYAVELWQEGHKIATFEPEQ